MIARSLLVFICSALLFVIPAIAEIKVIEAESTYVLGDNDSKVDGRRIAMQEAQRRALDVAGTYVSSITQVKEYRLTRDEVIAYTAGIVETQVIADEARGTLDHPELYIKVRCTVDTDILVRQIDRYRESEELREQLEAAAKEKEAFRKERDALLKQLSTEQDKEKAGETRKKLDTVLTREEGIAATTRVWVKLSPQIDFYDGRESRRGIKPADLDAAGADLRKVLERSPENIRARILLATVYQQQHAHAAAEYQLRTTLERAPKNALVHLQLGVVLREQGKYAEAFKEFRFIEHKRPNHPQMLFQTALTHKASGNCRLASAYMKRLLMYTKKNDRPEIARLKPKAKEVIEECGVQPVPKKRQR
jgi:tetratricopeptide (TPR) repeat protein